MRKKRFYLLSAVVVTAVLLGGILLPIAKDFPGSHTEYQCDVKFFCLNTEIEIRKKGKDFVKVSGNVFTFVTDPLTMYDFGRNKDAYAGDAYHFIAQDSHSIYVNGKFTAEMVGLVDLWGESYDIYDYDQNKIATVSFNGFDTSGEMYDTEGNLIADYTSKYALEDFKVRISEKCELDEKTVLMIFCSYYSDKSAD